MRGLNLPLLPLVLEIKRTARALGKAKIEVLLAEQQKKEEPDMADPPRQMFGD